MAVALVLVMTFTWASVLHAQQKPAQPDLSFPKEAATQGTEILQPDVTTPTLILMGGQDDELPPQERISRLEPMKDRGAPVEWHVFPNATHCWDCSDQHNQRWDPPWADGRSAVYLYDSKVTDESADRAFECLRLKLEPK